METYDAPATLDDVRASAAIKMDPSARRYFELSAGSGRMMRESEKAFRTWRLVPRVPRSVMKCRLNTSLQGQPVSMPVCIAPTALHSLANPGGELATARAAASAGSLMVLSSFSSASMAEVRGAAPECPLWLQASKISEDCLPNLAHLRALTIKDTLK
ncbi:2-Hydroxyacid oxidase 1-like [Haemaphysalis longicornis]